MEVGRLMVQIWMLQGEPRGGGEGVYHWKRRERRRGRVTGRTREQWKAVLNTPSAKMTNSR